jgi:hypothetical protein
LQCRNIVGEGVVVSLTTIKAAFKVKIEKWPSVCLQSANRDGQDRRGLSHRDKDVQDQSTGRPGSQDESKMNIQGQGTGDNEGQGVTPVAHIVKLQEVQNMVGEEVAVSSATIKAAVAALKRLSVVIKAASAAIFKIKILKRLSVSLQVSRLSRQLKQYSRSRH